MHRSKRPFLKRWRLEACDVVVISGALKFRVVGASLVYELLCGSHWRGGAFGTLQPPVRPEQHTMEPNKSIVVRIAPHDVETLKRGNLKLFVGRPLERLDGRRVVWKTFDNPGSNMFVRWDEDYASHSTGSAEVAEVAGGAVALWFGQHAEPGAIVDPSGAETILVDVAADDSAIVSYADGRWSRMEAE